MKLILDVVDSNKRLDYDKVLALLAKEANRSVKLYLRDKFLSNEHLCHAFIGKFFYDDFAPVKEPVKLSDIQAKIECKTTWIAKHWILEENLYHYNAEYRNYKDFDDFADNCDDFISCIFAYDDRILFTKKPRLERKI